MNRPGLYALENERTEWRNLADDPAHAERLAAMKIRLKAAQKETEDPWILKWQYE